MTYGDNKATGVGCPGVKHHSVPFIVASPGVNALLKNEICNT